jgi:hypothetical protein
VYFGAGLFFFTTTWGSKSSVAPALLRCAIDIGNRRRDAGTTTKPYLDVGGLIPRSRSNFLDSIGALSATKAEPEP